MIYITPIQTGTAQLKRAQQCGKEGRSALERKIDIFRDTEWVGPVPIFCFLVEHPEGRFLVDTGDMARNSVPGYLPRCNPFFMKEVIIKVAPLEEIGPRLQAMNLDPAMDIKAVILIRPRRRLCGHRFSSASATTSITASSSSSVSIFRNQSGHSLCPSGNSPSNRLRSRCRRCTMPAPLLNDHARQCSTADRSSQSANRTFCHAAPPPVGTMQ